MPLVLFRIVKSDPPTVRDFLSNHEKGMPFRGAELMNTALHYGVSTWETEEAAREMLARTGMKGMIARLEIPHDAHIGISLRSHNGHRTVWANPRDLPGYVVSIIPSGSAR